MKEVNAFVDLAVENNKNKNMSLPFANSSRSCQKAGSGSDVVKFEIVNHGVAIAIQGVSMQNSKFEN